MKFVVSIFLNQNYIIIYNKMLINSLYKNNIHINNNNNNTKQ